MSKQIAAIPTEYNNTLYRSRLEARWAIYLDVIKKNLPNNHSVDRNMAIEFEKYQFTIEDRTYKPDFNIKRFNKFTHLEIKPTRPSDEYLSFFRKIVASFPNEYFLLCFGNFYVEHTHQIVSHINIQVLDVKALQQLPFLHWQKQFFKTNNTVALKAAQDWRFDL